MEPNSISNVESHKSLNETQDPGPRIQDADEKKSKANDSTTVVYFDCKNTEIAQNIFYIHKNQELVQTAFKVALRFVLSHAHLFLDPFW